MSEQVYVVRLTETELVRLRRMYLRILEQHPIARVPTDKDIEAKLNSTLEDRPEHPKRPSEADERLVTNLRLCLAQRDPSKTAVQEFPRWSAEQCVDELERRLRVMRELCEAALIVEDESGEWANPDPWQKLQERVNAYRAMKREGR